MVATNILRDMVTDEKYDLLFLPMDPVKYPLDMNFKPKFRNKVRNQGVLSYQYIENKLLNGKQKLIKKGDILTKDQTNQFPIQELKTPKVLRVHGIKVLFTSFSELQPVDTQVYDHLFEAWSSRWERAATIQMSDFDKRARRIRYKGRIQAQQDIILSFAKIFKQNKNSREALAIRIFQALESTLTDPLSARINP